MIDPSKEESTEESKEEEFLRRIHGDAPGSTLMRDHPGFYSLSLSEYEAEGKAWYEAHYLMRPSWADSSLSSGGYCMIRFESAEARAYWLRCKSAEWRLMEAVAYKGKYEELVKQVAEQPGIKKLRKWLRGPVWRD